MEDDAYTEKVPSQGMRMGLWLDKGRIKQRQPAATTNGNGLASQICRSAVTP